MKLARRLYDARKEIVIEKNLYRVIVGGRLPGYGAHGDEMTAREYVDAVIEKRYYDPVLTSQLANGFKLMRLIPNYLPDDDESRGYATFLEWVNLDYQEGRKKHFLQVAPVRISVVQYELRPIRGFRRFRQAVPVLRRRFLGLQVRLRRLRRAHHRAALLVQSSRTTDPPPRRESSPSSRRSTSSSSRTSLFGTTSTSSVALSFWSRTTTCTTPPISSGATEPSRGSTRSTSRRTKSAGGACSRGTRSRSSTRTAARSRSSSATTSSSPRWLASRWKKGPRFSSRLSARTLVKTTCAMRVCAQARCIEKPRLRRDRRLCRQHAPRRSG